MKVKFHKHDDAKFTVTGDGHVIVIAGEGSERQGRPAILTRGSVEAAEKVAARLKRGRWVLGPKVEGTPEPEKVYVSPKKLAEMKAEAEAAKQAAKEAAKKAKAEESDDEEGEDEETGEIEVDIDVEPRRVGGTSSGASSSAGPKVTPIRAAAPAPAPASAAASAPVAAVPKRRGRPPGSKNKPKAVIPTAPGPVAAPVAAPAPAAPVSAPAAAGAPPKVTPVRVISTSDQLRAALSAMEATAEEVVNTAAQ